jgi:hypothetical protein
MTPKACWSIAALVVAQVFVMATAANAGLSVAVPEPTTLTLLGAGAAVAAVGAWWRHRK